jgi:adenine-specific DNA-methyltransferase
MKNESENDLIDRLIVEGDPEADFNTEGIRYSGSKRTIIRRIHETIVALQLRSVLDAFTGTTRVAQYFKKRGFDVHANDLAPYSTTLARCYIETSPEVGRSVRDKLRHLNAMPPIAGYFTQHYGGEDDGSGNVKSIDGKKKPFLVKNTMRLDAIRDEIDQIAANDSEKAVLLVSLINALDRIENTLGHQAAYLSKWAPRCYRDLTLVEPKLIEGNGNYVVSALDAKAVKGSFDLAYFDPPYNTNNTHTPTTRVRYASYYHFWTTVVRHDRPTVVGAANRRYDCSSDSLPGCISAYESTKYDVVLREVRDLACAIDARYLLFSYSNKGKLKKQDLLDVFSTRGRVSCQGFSHKENVQKNLTTNNLWLGDSAPNLEYLFLIETT